MDEEFPTPLPYSPLWAPWHFLHHLREDAPIVQIAVMLMLIAAIVFLKIALRTQPTHFFSLPLFLAFVPFMLGSCIMFLRLYLALGFSPYATLDSVINRIIEVGYPFQFGFVFTGGLFSIYVCAYFTLRNHIFPPRPDRPPPPPPRYDY